VKLIAWSFVFLLFLNFLLTAILWIVRAGERERWTVHHLIGPSKASPGDPAMNR
jgi:hypothetical protein